MKSNASRVAAILVPLVASLALVACGGATDPTVEASSLETPDSESAMMEAERLRRDTTPPVVSILAQSGSGTAQLSVSGSASDNVRIAAVTWSSDRGGSGQAKLASSTSKQTTWSATIPLQSGGNTITVTAVDAASLKGSASAVVAGPAIATTPTPTPAPTPTPTPSGGSWTYCAAEHDR